MNPSRLSSTFRALIAAACLLAGCGGGGDSGTAGGAAATTPATYPLQAGYAALVTSGPVQTYAISGACGGTATFTHSPAAASAFEGIAGHAVTQNSALNYTGCALVPFNIAQTFYYDAGYTPIGSITPGVEYAKFLAVPSELPASVKVGDSAVLVNFTHYSNSTKSLITGRSVLSYLVEADTASTAIVNFIVRAYNNADQLSHTQQTRFRIAGNGTLTALSIDSQFSTTSTVHLVYTRI